MRIPEDIDQAINYVSQLEKIEKAQSRRKLDRLGFEYYGARNYRDGSVTFYEYIDYTIAKWTLRELTVRGERKYTRQ